MSKHDERSAIPLHTDGGPRPDRVAAFAIEDQILGRWTVGGLDGQPEQWRFVAEGHCFRSSRFARGVDSPCDASSAQYQLLRRGSGTPLLYLFESNECYELAVSPDSTTIHLRDPGTACATAVVEEGARRRDYAAPRYVPERRAMTRVP